MSNFSQYNKVLRMIAQVFRSIYNVKSNNQKRGVLDAQQVYVHSQNLATNPIVNKSMKGRKS